MTPPLTMPRPRTMADILKDWGEFDDGLDGLLDETTIDELYELALSSQDMILGPY